MSNIKDTNFQAMSEYWNANISRVIKVNGKYIPIADDKFLDFVTATAGDIASGKTGADEHGYPVFGTYKPSGGNSGAVDLYKCVSIDGATQTWGGRKAVLTDSGEYVISDAVTNGLSFAGGLNVKKGKVYAADGKIRSSKAYNHCICLFPFNMNYEDMRSNCKIPLLYGSQPNNQAYYDGGQKHWGAGSLLFNVNSIYAASIQIKDLPALDAFTVEFWQFRKNTPGIASYGAMRLPGYLANKPMNSDTKTSEILYGTDEKFASLPIGRWFHHAFVKQAGSDVVTEFVDGVVHDNLSFPYTLGGAGFSAVQFSTMPAEYNLDTHEYGVDKIDGYYTVVGAFILDCIADFSIWDIAKYSGNFTPPAEPYKIEWEDLPTITLSGAGLEDVNGTYELITPEAAGKSRVWAKPMSPYLIKYDDDWWCWLIKNGENNCYSGSESDDPWKDEWYDATDDESGGDAPTFTVNE